MDNYNEIVDNLFLGNYKSPDLLQNHVYLIVNCSKDLEFPKRCKQCIRITINDDPTECNTLLNYMLHGNILEKIHAHLLNKTPVLVHCFAGMQRSCAVVACYLIKYHNASPILATDYIKNKRRQAFFGNVNFMKTLEMFYSITSQRRL
jgi:protein-tyrosine phosphatase